MSSKEENKSKKLKEVLKSKKKLTILILIILVIIIVVSMLGLTVFNKNWKESSSNYKETLKIAIEKNNELNKIIEDSEKLVNSKKIALDETLRPTLETAISEAKAARKEIPNKPLFVKKIKEKTEELKKIDYKKEYANLKTQYDLLDKSIKQYSMVDNPSEAYIINALKKISSIVDISAVTEENDPNGHLNKQGGYTAQVYFSSKYVNQKAITGKTVIDKGTKAGGSIEVYKTTEDAKKREEYLAGFDGGVLASGSHKVIGTVLIRTSDELTATKQKELEANIIAALTGEEIKENSQKEETKKPAEQKPKYNSVVGTYNGPDGTINFKKDGTLVANMIDRGITNPGNNFTLYGNWTQSGNTVTCTLYNNDGVWTPQTITVTKSGISNWWGDFYSKVS